MSEYFVLSLLHQVDAAILSAAVSVRLPAMIMSFSGLHHHHSGLQQQQHAHKQAADLQPAAQIKTEDEETISAAAAAAAAMQTAIKKHTIDAILGLPRLEGGCRGEGEGGGGGGGGLLASPRFIEGKLFRVL